MGRFGERLAALVLQSHGLEVVSSNVQVGDGEIDLVALDGRQRVVIEVRSTTGGYDPIDAIGPEKRRRVRHLAGRAGATRVDFVGVRLSRDAAIVHWVPGEV